MTDIAVTSSVERIARVIAAGAFSANADGDENSASKQVESHWRYQLPRALEVLRTLREPTPEMVEAGAAAGGDPAEVWNAMVRAAIDQYADEFAA